MSSKTKIVVLHLREIIYTGIFALLAILFLVILIVMFLPKNKEKSNMKNEAPSDQNEESTFTPGVYSAPLSLGSMEVSIQVVIDDTGIIAVDSPNADETVTALYPLLKPAIADLETQIIANQGTEQLDYPEESKYTSLCIIAAVDDALANAKGVPETDVVSQNPQ